MYLTDGDRIVSINEYSAEGEIVQELLCDNLTVDEVDNLIHAAQENAEAAIAQLQELLRCWTRALLDEWHRFGNQTDAELFEQMLERQRWIEECEDHILALSLGKDMYLRLLNGKLRLIQPDETPLI